MRRPLLSYAVDCLIGLAFSSAYPLGIALAVAMPAFVLRQRSRSAAYRTAACYYAGALWPLVPGARNFYGPRVSSLSELAVWTAAWLLLASPWPLVWSANPGQWWWRATCGLALGVVPPLGLIGWASPLMGAGFLFPGTRWWGLAACALAPGLLTAYPRRTAPLIIGVAVVCNLMRAPVPPPPGWIAIDTHFGAIAHQVVTPVAEYQVAQTIQRATLSTSGKVFLFPETVVPVWTAATDAFWQPTLERLRSSGKVAIIGARLPVPGAAAGVPSSRDLGSALVILQGGTASGTLLRAQPPEFRYDNAVVIRGAESTFFRQRIPVPIAMWKPFQHDSARLNLFGPGVIRIGKRRAAPLICYEQLLVWPVITSLLQGPDILLAPANDYWAAGTLIPAHQITSMESWSRLFRLPYLAATNI